MQLKSASYQMALSLRSQIYMAVITPFVEYKFIKIPQVFYWQVSFEFSLKERISCSPVNSNGMWRTSTVMSFVHSA
jgi:hypothetical protein